MPGGADLDIRPAVDGDLPAILDLLRGSMDGSTTPKTEAYWCWKHARSPFGPSSCLLASDEGRVVGVRAFMRWQWRSGARLVTAARAVDTVTHRDWRGRGIFRRLTLELLEHERGAGVEFVFNTPNAKSRPGYLSMGWQLLGRVDLWARGRPALLRRLARPLVEPSNEDGPCDGSVASLLREQRLDAALARMEPSEASSRLRTPRTLEYLRWRYGDAPAPRYVARWDLSGGRAAVVIGRARRRGPFREAVVSEVLVAPDLASIRAAAGLIRELGADLDADYLAAMGRRRSRQGLALALAGFVPTPRLGPAFTVRPLRESPAVSERSSWDWSIGDLEVF